MKKLLIVVVILVSGIASKAQFSKASLQASGLTCSMCSKAVKDALQGVNFVEKIQVDIKNQQYNLTFKTGAEVNLDALSKAVIDAGFSVAALKVTANVDAIKATKDAHVLIGNQYLHFLNGTGQQLTGPVTFSVVDKGFVSSKEAKKWSAASNMPCVQTGKMEACCKGEGVDAATRVYHVII